MRHLWVFAGRSIRKCRNSSIFSKLMGTGSQLAADKSLHFFISGSLIHTAIGKITVWCTLAHGIYAHAHKHSQNLQGPRKTAQGKVRMTW